MKLKKVSHSEGEEKFKLLQEICCWLCLPEILARNTVRVQGAIPVLISTELIEEINLSSWGLMLTFYRPIGTWSLYGRMIFNPIHTILNTWASSLRFPSFTFFQCNIQMSSGYYTLSSNGCVHFILYRVQEAWAGLGLTPKGTTIQ